jgi:Fur family iron response transcriptional regulator
LVNSSSISHHDRHIDRLREHNLRPTRQRVALAELLFNGPCRHVSAEQLRLETEAKGIRMSLATIYNTLNQFTRVGLLHEISLDNNVTYFDTNIDHHHHFFDSKTNDLIDIPKESIALKALPEAPEGRHVERVDVVIRLR